MSYIKKIAKVLADHKPVTTIPKLPKFKRMENVSLVDQRKLLSDLYKTLFSRLGNPAVGMMAAQILKSAPESHIELEWENVKNGDFQEVVHTLLTYELDRQDMSKLLSLFQGILVPYTKHQQEIPAEDMKWASTEILTFVRSLRKKRELRDASLLKANEMKLLDQVTQ